MAISASFIKLLEKVEPGLREVLIALLEEMEKRRIETVTKEEFNELKAIVKELAEAQKRTEERIKELAEAQKRTEEMVKELAEAQKRTEERISKVEERVTKLETAVHELAEAQKRTEEELRMLIGEHRKTREILGNLQHTVGYVLEDRAIFGLPPLLKKDFGIEIIEPLRREYIEISPGKYIEINIIGKGRMNGKEVWIIGECKTQIKKKDVDNFLKNLSIIERVLRGKKIPIVVTYQTSPPLRNYIKEKGLKLYFSYQFPL